MEYSSAILRFMCLLGWLAKKHGADFEMALYYRGRGSRVLIARSPTPILESGNSTFPKQIPESSYWVCTNLSNKSKAQVVDGVMTILNYPAPERRKWMSAIDAEDSERSEVAWETDDEDDDDLRI
jgi:negative modulator of initiation of replication